MVERIVVKGVFEENCYFYIDDSTRHGFVIDPGAEAGRLLAVIRKHGWTIEKILLTHGHFDHTGAVAELRDSLKVPALAHSFSDAYMMDPEMNLSAFCGGAFIVPDVLPMRGGDVLRLEANRSFSLQVWHTPGHTEDSIVLYSAADHLAFTGDTIFRGGAGTARYPGGNPAALRKSILETVFSFPPETLLLPGHGLSASLGGEKGLYSL